MRTSCIVGPNFCKKNTPIEVGTSSKGFSAGTGHYTYGPIEGIPCITSPRGAVGYVSMKDGNIVTLGVRTNELKNFLGNTATLDEFLTSFKAFFTRIKGGKQPLHVSFNCL